MERLSICTQTGRYDTNDVKGVAEKDAGNINQADELGSEARRSSCAENRFIPVFGLEKVRGIPEPWARKWAPCRSRFAGS